MQLREYQTDSVAAAFTEMRRGLNPCIVLPTGSGKSLVIAELCRQAVTQWKGRVLILAHRKELLVQNAEKIEHLLPGFDVGIYSAGLNSKDGWQDIVVAGVQSIYRKPEVLGVRHLAIIDEAHLIPRSDGGMYETLIRQLRIVFPKMKLCGLTATPFRMDCGSILNDSTLNSICYEASVSSLIKSGYLCQLTNDPTTQVDVSGVKVHQGEFIQQQLEECFLRQISVNVKEAMQHLAGRKSVLWFTSGVSHANRVADCIDQLTGEFAVSIVGDTTPLERASSIEKFRSRQLRHLVNCNVLTTGFDAPNIDAIVVLRATRSAGLFAQICGRGFRICEGKQNCLVLDFGGNIARHGALDAADYGRRKREGSDNKESILSPEENRTKSCAKCGSEISIRCVYCPVCGVDQPITVRLDDVADTQSEILKEDAKPEWHYVESVGFSEHVPKQASGKHSLRVDYQIPQDGNLTTSEISEWVCVEHSGYAQTKARQWWALHTEIPFTDQADEAVEYARCGGFRAPRRIQAIREGRFWRVVDREFDDERPTVDVLTEVDSGSLVPFDDDDDIPF